MLPAVKHQDAVSSLPFDNHLLDRLMDETCIDVALTTSKHNVQYLLGGHRTFFFDHMEAMGTSRYLPVLAYPRGAPEQASYVGHGTEAFQHALSPFWTPEVYTGPAGSTDSMQRTIDHLRKLGLKPRRIGVELPFLPADAAMLLQNSFPDAEIVDSLLVLERLRARKTPEELRKLRLATDTVIDSMLAVIAGHGPGVSKQEMVDALRREETNRGLIFEYPAVIGFAPRNANGTDLTSRVVQVVEQVQSRLLVWHRHQDSVEISDGLETSEDDPEFFRGYMQRSAHRIAPLFGEEAVKELGGADRADGVANKK
jgi:Xaa-Pro aminopeptidase